MSRKKKTSAKKSRKHTPQELACIGAEHLTHQRFKEAATVYKQLLKQERRPEWLDGLAEAYAGRAARLASRGMFKEAIALWQNRADVCGKPLADSRYLQWLVAADRIGDIVRLYQTHATALAGSDGVAGLRARLAAAALADGGELIKQLPPDDPVARDYAAANTALEAYAARDDEALQSALKQIAFRSPYRDFRQLLKALLRYEQDPEGAAALCARVRADSPFAGLAQALQATQSLDPNQTLDAHALLALPTGVQGALSALAGWRAEQFNLLRPLARLGAQPSVKNLFDFVLAQRKRLGGDYARTAAFMLAGDDWGLHRRLQKTYSKLPNSEAFRLLALFSELSGQSNAAIEQWQSMLELQAHEPAADADDALRRALVHRHVADLLQPSAMGVQLDADAIEHLATSLALDPDDRSSYLRLADHYLHMGDLKQARHWTQQALQQYPGDPDCLFRAAETAVAGKAFKKAAKFARRILAQDPINADARGLLVDSHLGHARKQIKARKAEAARGEIATASEFARGSIDTARVALVGGLTALACAQADAAGPELAAAVDSVDDALVGRFLLLLEAVRAGLKLAPALRAAGLSEIKALGEPAHVWALVDTLGTLRAGQIETAAVEAALRKLEPAFTQAAKSPLQRARAERVCETWLRYHQYATLRRFARTALRQWRHDPLFTFYWVMGNIAHGYFDPISRDRELLEMAFERAQVAGDKPTAHRIGATLDALMPMPAFGPGTFDPFADDDLPPLPTHPAWQDADLDIKSLRQIVDLLLPPDCLDRLDEALRKGKQIPQDIMDHLASVYDDSSDHAGSSPGTPTQAMPKPQKRQGKQPGTPKPQNTQRSPRNPAQGELFDDDLFGDDW